MSGDIITCQLLGGLGGQLFQYAFARAYAEKYGAELHCPPWIGQRVFTISDPPMPATPLPARTLFGLSWGETNVHLEGYMTHQRAMIYTREQARRWFTLQPAWEEMLERIMPREDFLVAHRRTGDYIGNPNYPLLSRECYRAACRQYGYDAATLRFVEVETAITHHAFTGAFAFLPDFYRLMRTPILFRGNSGFSWWASLLGMHWRVYSPLVVGLTPGIEQDAVFVPGNAPAIVENGLVTDLEIAS
jgi:hypothetical protein